MSYTRVDYDREITQRFLAALTSEERLRGLMSNEVLSHYKPDKRLAGLTTEQIRAYLQQLENPKLINFTNLGNKKNSLVFCRKTLSLLLKYSEISLLVSC